MSNPFYANQKDYIAQLNKLWTRATLSLTGTSTTSATMGTGDKSFTTDADRQWSPNQPIIITSTSSPTNYMVGTVKTYDSSTGALVATISSINGSGTFASWTIALGGTQGTAGVSVTSGTVNGSGHLILTLSDSSTIDAGYVLGADGSDGVSVTGATVNGSDHLILTLSDSSTIDAGYVKGDTGDVGPANSLDIGTVTSGASPSASITGTAPTQTLNLVLPKGDPGDAGSLSIGTVTTGAPGSSASASITGTAPTQTLNLTIPRGADGSGNVNSVNGVAPVAGDVTLTKEDIGLGDVELTTNKVTSMSGTSTDTEYPSAKAVYDALAAKETLTSAGALINSATTKVTPVDADMVGLMDSAASNVLKKLSWANVKATLKTYFDTLYQTVLESGTNIKTINSTSLLGAGNISLPTASDLSAKLDKANGTATDSLSVVNTATTGDGKVVTSAKVNNRSGLYCQTDGVNRWFFGKDESAESGGDVGSRFVFTGFDDSGASLGEVLTIYRNTGVVDFFVRPTLGGEFLATQSEVAAVNDTILTGVVTMESKTLVNPTINGYTEGTATASGTSFSPSLAQDTVFAYATTGNASITLPAPTAGKSFQIQIDFGGAHTLSWSVTGGTTIRWPSGTAPTPTSTAGKSDVFNFTCDAHGTAWFGAVFGQAYTT